MAADHFCLRWNNYQSNMVSELDILRTEEYLVDVTLSCEGHKLRAHKVILSACSPYFRNVFKENPCEHPVVILKDVSHEDVEALLSFVYQGVVYVSEKKLSSFLQTAELLQIKGLAGAASSLNEEHAKLASSVNNNSPGKRRKGAPMRIMKQDDSEETNSSQMETEENVKREFADEMDDSNTYQEDDGSLEESESENSNEVTTSNYSSLEHQKHEFDHDQDGFVENEGGGGESAEVHAGVRTNEAITNMIQNKLRLSQVQHQQQSQQQQQQQTLQQTQLRPSPITPQTTMDNSIQGTYQLSPTPNQGMSEILSPAGERNGRRPCPLCTKVISNKSNLLKHMRIRHSGAYNPACCVLCNKIFKNKYSLRAHLNIYHKEYLTPTQQMQPQSQTQAAVVIEPQLPQFMPSV